MRATLSTQHPTMHFVAAISCEGVEWYVPFVLPLFSAHFHEDSAGSTAVRVLKSFVQTNFLSSGDQSPGFETLVPTLAEQFDDIVPPRARSCVLWLVGQYAPSTTATAIPGINDWAADVLRRAVKSFVDEVWNAHCIRYIGIDCSLRSR
jgi:hypothetical protein